jgi:hypothetical protein
VGSPLLESMATDALLNGRAVLESKQFTKSSHVHLLSQLLIGIEVDGVAITQITVLLPQVAKLPMAIVIIAPRRKRILELEERVQMDSVAQNSECAHQMSVVLGPDFAVPLEVRNPDPSLYHC